MKYLLMTIFWLMSFVACGGQSQGTEGTDTTDKHVVNVPQFNTDSAFYFVKAQVDFGPRIMNSTAHDDCGDYLAAKLEQYGAKVYNQRADLPSYEGKMLKARNIIGAFNPEAKRRIALFAHWDSRPWADNDPDPSKHYTPILGANDGASGVGVLLEVARILQQQPTTVGIDIILLDAEDMGNHRDSGLSDEKSWCLGSQYWARTPHVEGYNARFGILLDMVGGANARFQYEYYSEQYARDINRKVWKAAKTIGYDNYFVAEGGGGATDDHLFINQIAHIPTIDIIPTSQQYTFFEHWHTVKDDMDAITVPTLKAVGQTLLQVIYNER
ncbi:MAG: M28 family peptidase [Bacteroidaceae bacterium]|nr:M28 family peptidase [Bacteroidaceae bacterium]